MPRPFLVLTDFTAAADTALRYAADLAKPLGASLVLLHIRRESLLDPDAFMGTIRHLTEGEVAAALEERTRGLAVPVTVESTADGIEAAVSDAVRRHQPSLVVLGKPDTEETPDELVSSTSLKLLRATRTPLLVVPISHTAQVPPQRITIAADDLPFSLKPQTEAIRELLGQLQPTITVEHVVEPEDRDDCTASRDAVLKSGLTAEISQVRTHGVRHLHTVHGILQGAAETHADLLLVVARRRSFLGQLFNRSVTSQVILHGRLPMLLLPALE
ncbi:Nucleotide-binding universal stress protein, UspA family [Hymenobacter gelipurpurascens]|uniref:Nucleotide-binding universal stress protein, UspA family n=1 Tax=Hymenobacter gelipurpurascens TaxID=89968 RepID=A0A212TLM1_9BACT|nr:universal stress protein [Hymenobacter gelipurpurascens]SNC66721.1 Nucleotide-binding universal stress protein, UspA family [Hymenobacter gelipurpurascens]